MIHNLFPTAISCFSLEENKQNKEECLKYLYELQNTDAGANRSNVNSWHSSPKFNIIEASPFKSIKSFIVDSLKSTINDLGYDKIKLRQTESWCIISPTGAYNKSHHHPGGFISGSYYINSPSAPITFHDPRTVKAFTEPRNSSKITPYNSVTVSFKPKEGDLLLFPSWLEHSVSENTSHEDRVILSFNFGLV